MKRSLFSLLLLLAFTACQNTGSPTPEVTTPEVAIPEPNAHLLTIGVSVDSDGAVTLVDLQGNRLDPEGYLTNGTEINSVIDNIANIGNNTFTFNFTVTNNSANAWSDFRLGHHPKTSARVRAIGYDVNGNDARFETGEVLYDRNAGINAPVAVPNTVFSTGQMEPVGSSSGVTSFTAPMAVRYSSTPFTLFLTVDAVDPSKPILVDADAPGYFYGTTRYYDGATWATAYPNLQDALARARSSAATEIWIAAGTYYPDEGDNVTVVRIDTSTTPNTLTVTTGPADNDRDATFFVSEGMKIYGGFAGTETTLSERDTDLTANVTTLSGDIDGDGAFGSNARHVMYLDGSTTAITGATVIDRVSVTAGQADASFPENAGGAMYNLSSSPTLTNVTFAGNTAGSGGAIFNEESNPTLTDVTFTGNTASSDGGAMLNLRSSPTLTNVTFTGNTASFGGAMYNPSSSPTLTNVTFSGNTASNNGGAMFNSSNSPTLTNVTFSGNTANVGGAMLNSSSSPALTNATFSGNTASFAGGAIYNRGSGSPTLTNVILWGNTATNGSQVYQDSGTLTISYSIVEGGSAGILIVNAGTSTYDTSPGNIDDNPLFNDADGADDTFGTADDDLNLQACSPAIDAGDNSASGLGGVTTDLAGNDRFFDDTGVTDSGNGSAPIVDMGAFEFQGTSQDCPTSGTFTAAANYSVGSSPASVTSGDFNGDNVLDLAVANQASNSVSVLLGNGNGTFMAAANYGVGDRPRSVTSGDFDGDGALDLAVANSGASSNVSVLLGNGNGTFMAAANYGAGSGPASVTSGDFNGDGALDLAVANFDSNDVSVLLGNGNGTFMVAANYGVRLGPASVTSGDFDGDGALDLATANYNSANVSVLLQIP